MITLNLKSELRKKAIEMRTSMAISGELKSLSSKIILKILNSENYKIAKNIALYMPIKNEIDITPLLNDKSKKFYLPRCSGDVLEFCLYENINSLRKGNFGILEPVGKSVKPEILDIIYIPALMANNKCFRLGYGKGYYDRFFSMNKLNAKKIIIVSHNLVSNDFIQDKFDVQCDEIISEK